MKFIAGSDGFVYAKRETAIVHYVIQRLRAKGLLSEGTNQGRARSLVPM